MIGTRITRRSIWIIRVILLSVLLVGSAFAQRDNTAYGLNALGSITSGNENSAFGSSALYYNMEGNFNTAGGAFDLFNTIGSENTGTGYSALLENTTGSDNTAQGIEALGRNTIGLNNTATGAYALHLNTTGNANIAIGYQAGYNSTGSNNIEIGSLGTANEDGTIRLGTEGKQSATYIAGISGTPMTGGEAVNVVVSGQLGVRPSSNRYKRDIQPLDHRSGGLWQLRPVTFRYKQDPKGSANTG